MVLLLLVIGAPARWLVQRVGAPFGPWGPL